ncbi:Increased DNA methylation 1 [Spatholobus suberectus]|nr:Increased DNA methylation 1 [Spatholobus suberectus]
MERAITGRITRGGILCSCCQGETSVWTFEKHAGSDLRQPYKHIYLPRKHKCLEECQIDAWQDTREQKRWCKFLYVPKETAADQNDDACSVCGDGGDLICCDKCPSTYHLSCMNIERVPQNDWFCPYCVCKFCGLVVEKKEGFKCSQCDKKCHWECFQEFSKENLDLNPSRSYCGPGCQEIYEKLEVSLGIRNDNLAKYSWRVIHQMDIPKDKEVAAAMNLYLENNSKVAVTWMLMNEAFETITDRHTGINIIQSIVYSCGSNLTRIDFSRFYMFVLEKDDEIIAAASIRFHGRGIAEMPFIATEMAYRGQGVCQELIRVIESFLCDLKVKNLVIPSALETSDMWKRKYNFTEVSEELKKEISSYNILMFPCALRLYKNLSASIADGGDDIEDDQTDIKNNLEPQKEQAEATARLEHGPSSG